MVSWDYVANWCEWVAPVTTIIAAILTALNLGARVTGWGFAVFLIGSVHWTMLGIATGQKSLMAANSFLCAINAVGIWRWLGVKAQLDDGAEAAEDKSEDAAAPTLINLASIEGKAVTDPGGNTVGHIRGAMVESKTGRISYVVIACGGIGGINETLHSLPWTDLTAKDEGFEAPHSQSELRALERVDAADWPATARAA